MDKEKAQSNSNGAEKVLFRRLLDTKTDPKLCMRILAMWMWLVSKGFEQLLSKINSQSNQFFSSILSEAKGILNILEPSSSTTPISSNHFPMTSTLSKFPKSLGEILREKDGVLKGIEGFYSEFSRRFKDVLEEKGGVVTGEKTGSSLGQTSKRFSLNPFAKAWSPLTDLAPEEDRCLFLTFSNGYPLTERQIINFFTSRYGPCVQRVYVHYPEYTNIPPLFGKVVFTASYIVAVVLGGQTEAKFVIDRKTLWCKKYEPKRNRSFGETAGT